VMVNNNSTNITKMNKHLSSQAIEYPQKHVVLKIQVLA